MLEVARSSVIQKIAATLAVVGHRNATVQSLHALACELLLLGHLAFEVAWGLRVTGLPSCCVLGHRLHGALAAHA